MLNFHIDDAIRLTSTLAGEAPFTCQRLGTNWRLTAPVRENANNTEVNAIMYELDDLTADAFIGNKSTPTDAAHRFQSTECAADHRAAESESVYLASWQDRCVRTFLCEIST